MNNLYITALSGYTRAFELFIECEIIQKVNKCKSTALTNITITFTFYYSIFKSVSNHKEAWQPTKY